MHDKNRKWIKESMKLDYRLQTSSVLFFKCIACQRKQTLELSYKKESKIII